MKRRTIKASVAAMSIAMALGGASAYAFDDVSSKEQLSLLDSLRSKGIVSGVTSQLFHPDQRLTEAQGIQMIVNAYDLDDQANEEANAEAASWYDGAVSAATAHGLSIPEQFDANNSLTREVFAQLLYEGLNTTGTYPTILRYNFIADGDKINKNYESSIQTLLNMNIVSLNEKDEFRPDEELTRMEAAEMVFNALEVVDRYGNGGGSAEQPGTDIPGSGQQAYVPEVTSQTVDEKTIKVKLSMELPNPGYGLEIKKVELGKDGKAIIKYQIIQPDPDKMYPQVITERTAETNIPSGYTPLVEPFS
ncbi:S-layer homology domain-containing protein [Paenibacillus provencensis]|uniref:S-layer homology domain-containing protein n=1 Tax=Paenibacillus provencensis TaxID=441151 RepID=A0ABW3PY82_9BACL|nr:S-layer homology domain-containing protein [Paenibacillus sp. MER 78]MCM3127765.1 S-layer homology domain-containing protein [Paenibacillus sp. MER 78]